MVQLNSGFEHFPFRLQAKTMRVKGGRWFTPLEMSTEDTAYFPTKRVASLLGNRALKHEVPNFGDTLLLLPMELQSTYYKSAVGLLSDEGGTILGQLRLETMSIDAETKTFAIQHALIDYRNNRHGDGQFRFR